MGGGGQTYSTANPIAGTEDDTLYQYERFGMTQYAFDVSPGTYSVTLKFAEIYYNTKVGDRVFSVRAEGVTVVTGLDLLKTVGRYVAYDYSFLATVTDYQLNLEFQVTTGAAKVNAIRVMYLGGGAETATPTPTPSQTPVVLVTGTPTITRTPTSTPLPHDPYEPNDSTDQATSMSPNRDYLGYIESTDDVDFFAFDVSDPNAFIWGALTDLPADYDLFLHGPDGAIVGWSNYGGRTPEYILNYAVNGQSGRYYLRVVGYNRAYSGDAPYRLRVELRAATPTATPTRTATGTATPTLTPTATRTATATATRLPLDPNEPNNVFDQATVSTPGTAYFGYMDSAGDVDFYRFTVAAAGRQIAVSLTQLPADYDLYLADPARLIVATSRYGGAANEYVYWTALTPGTYYVYVVGFNHAYEPLLPYRVMIQVSQ